MDICVEHLCKTYGMTTVLNDFSFVFPEGKTTCIMGRSGIGKTTLLSILMGIETADSGTVTGVEGKKLAAVFQENRLFENLDAIRNIEVVTGRKQEEIKALLDELLLPAEERKPVATYSGGMKRRVAIARALLSDADILFLDEPLQGLDGETKEQVAGVMREQMQGKTVLLVTHEESECDFFGAECVFCCS